MKSLMLIVLINFLPIANARVQTYPEPELEGTRGQCYETNDCDNEDHAAMLLPLEMCGRVLKLSGDKQGSWKELGSHICVSINMSTVQE